VAGGVGSGAVSATACGTPLGPAAAARCDARAGAHLRAEDGGAVGLRAGHPHLDERAAAAVSAGAARRGARAAELHGQAVHGTREARLHVARRRRHGCGHAAAAACTGRGQAAGAAGRGVGGGRAEGGKEPAVWQACVALEGLSMASTPAAAAGAGWPKGATAGAASQGRGGAVSLRRCCAAARRAAAGRASGQRP
jgi:hypothetical protein